MWIFGYLLGDPPADEVEILRGQVKLLHNQLLFERHKCDLHAIRNRRLIGKTFKAVQYQEELLATVSISFKVHCKTIPEFFSQISKLSC